MISRRDVLVSLITAIVVGSVVALGQSQKPLMTSSVFDWEKIPVKETPTGSSRDFFKSPTATLDQLE